MKIDLSKMRICWWEDREGNILELEENRIPTEEEKEKYPFYHFEFPCQVHHRISYYGYHPRGIQKLLIKLPVIGNYVKKKLGKTHEEIGTFGTTFRSGSDCIVAMINSGDYTLEEAIWIYTNSCERCMNALCYKYLDGKEGYEEYSEEWHKANTVCDFCKDELKEN